MAGNKITFSTRPFTVGEIELAQLLASGSLTPAIELVVRRADPPVTRSQVEALNMEEWTELMNALSASVSTSIFLTNLLGGLAHEDGK